jgi:hypothetical protein
MSTIKFESYFTGSPLIKILFSYDTVKNNMTRKMGRKSETVSITDEQISNLNQLSPDNQIQAAHIFASANE